MDINHIIDVANNQGHVNAAKKLAEFIKEDTKDGQYTDTAKLIKDFLQHNYKRHLPDLLIYTMNYGVDGADLFKIFTQLEVDGSNFIFNKKDIKNLKEVVEEETNNEEICSLVEKLGKEIR